ncbi:MAG TPA: hypothetical protein VFM06_06540 [Candidatus Limnocylindria bacterium]|nr:hypothetical protein [Candidatus Limnocylindria bacterium]
MPIEVIAVLRQRNQLTLPDRLASALDARPGDELALTFDESMPSTAQLRVLPRSYAGIVGDLYGRTAQERAAYIAEERATWDEREDPGRASDGTPYLTFEESRRTYRRTEVTRERYDREPKLRWPKCEICGRSIARMKDHRRKHAANVMDDKGVSTDPEQVERSRRRVRRWRAARAAGVTKGRAR